ncbi:MerR family DNA-binding transcriptional regulator [Nonomuraea ceibae]|uniref:MerR family DNA-binding transcriptional regulator n=1 Tax=Nonomuraea ceibae TaxID=1935170 RepID=UPI001C60062B
MRIGELAAATGVSVRALRYYEEQSLLAAERDRIDRQIRDLTGTRDRLDAAIATASLAREAGRPCPR